MACPFTSAATLAGGECLHEARKSAAIPAARTTRMRFIGVSLYCSPEGGRTGTDRPDSEFPAKSAGNSCQACQSPWRARSFGLGVVVGVLAIELGSAGAVGDDAQDVVLAQRLHGAGDVVEGRGADLDHQDRAIRHGGKQVGIGREQQRRGIEDRPVEAAREFLEEQLGLVYLR